MSVFDTIDLPELATVTGGDGDSAVNQVNVNGELDGELAGVGGLASLKIKGQGSVQIQRSNYGECLTTMKGRPTDDIVKACGMPPNAVKAQAR